MAHILAVLLVTLPQVWASVVVMQAACTELHTCQDNRHQPQLSSLLAQLKVVTIRQAMQPLILLLRLLSKSLSRSTKHSKLKLVLTMQAALCNLF
jgi:hypothetical protein